MMLPIFKKEIPQKLTSFILFFIRNYKAVVCIFLILISITSLYSVCSSYFIKRVVDNLEGLRAGESAFSFHVLWPGLAFVATGLVISLAWRAMQYIRYRTQPQLRREVVHGIFEAVLRQSPKFFHERLSGTLAGGISILSDNMMEVLYDHSVQVLRYTIALLASFVGVYYVNPLLFWGLMLWCVGFFTITLFFMPRLRDLAGGYAESQAEVSGKIVDSVSNAQSVFLFGTRRYELSFLDRALLYMGEKYRKKEWFSLKLSLFQGLSLSAVIGMMIVILLSLRNKGMVSTGDFAMILTLSVAIAEDVWELTEEIYQLSGHIGQCQRGLEIVRGPLAADEAAKGADLVLSRGEITFSQVTFGYGGDYLFDRLSTTIEGGQRVGLVGYSGAGKTSFVNLILRLYDVEKGCVCIDGQDVRSVSRESLCNAIGVIPQEPSLFHRSLWDNVAYGRWGARREEIEEACEASGVAEFAAHLEFGYQTLLGERGARLSGGQRQRIAIARVLLKKAPLLILDEATAQVDSLSERDLQQSLWSLMQEKTTLVIAHRLSTLLRMDRLLVFHKGTLLEDGTHHELLQRQGLYARLWASQVGGFIPTDVP